MLEIYLNFSRSPVAADRGTLSLQPYLSIKILCIKLRSSPYVTGYKIENQEILLSLYADDCSNFLEYNENNLENAIIILNDFYHVSGLKIHLTKTQCVVFGHIPNDNYEICNHISLKWDQNFKLPGVETVEFDGMLENMHSNYENNSLKKCALS